MQRSRKQILWGRLKNFGLLTFLFSASAIVLYVLWVSTGSSMFMQFVSNRTANAVPYPVPILTINKNDNPSDNVQPGAVLTYTITYSNVGYAVATGVIITDTFDNLVTFERSWPIGPTGSVGNVRYWKIDDLGIGDHRNITVTVIVSTSAASGIVLTNLVQIDSPDAEMASSIETTTVVAGDLGLYLPIVVNCWELSPCESPDEPNGARCSAHPISTPTCITSHICSSNDRNDYYYINVKVPSTIRITLTDFAPDYDLYLYGSPTGPHIDLSNTQGKGVSESITWQGARPGVYYIRVYTLWEIQPVVPGSYRLCVTF